MLLERIFLMEDLIVAEVFDALVPPGIDVLEPMLKGRPAVNGKSAGDGNSTV